MYRVYVYVCMYVCVNVCEQYVCKMYVCMYVKKVSRCQQTPAAHIISGFDRWYGGMVVWW